MNGIVKMLDLLSLYTVWLPDTFVVPLLVEY